MRYVLIAVALLIPGYFTVTRVDRVIDCFERSNVEVKRANDQIALMHLKLEDTSRKLDQTNAALPLTNAKFDETNTPFVALDNAFQKFPFLRK